MALLLLRTGGICGEYLDKRHATRPYCRVAHPAVWNNPEILNKYAIFFLFVFTVAWRTQRYVVIQCMLLCARALQMLMAFARTFYIVQYVEDGNSAQCSFFIADLNL